MTAPTTLRASLARLMGSEGDLLDCSGVSISAYDWISFEEELRTSTLLFINEYECDASLSEDALRFLMEVTAAARAYRERSSTETHGRLADVFRAAALYHASFFDTTDFMLEESCQSVAPSSEVTYQMLLSLEERLRRDAHSETEVRA